MAKDLCVGRETRGWRKGLCFGADLIISLDALEDRGDSSVRSERDRICQIFRPCLCISEYRSPVRLGPLQAKHRSPREPWEQGSSPGRCLDRHSGTELTGRDGISSGQWCALATATTPSWETSTPREGGTEIGAGQGLSKYHSQGCVEQTSPARARDWMA